MQSKIDFIIDSKGYVSQCNSDEGSPLCRIGINKEALYRNNRIFFYYEKYFLAHSILKPG